MKVDRGFCRDVTARCYDALEAAGFTRYRKKGVDWPLRDGFNAWIGLNEGWENDYFEINPYVGVHAEEIEKLWKSLTQIQYQRSGATYALHMGELAPNERAFRFFHGTDLDFEAKRLATLYATVGLLYSKSIATYDALLPLLRERVETLGAYPERLACCLYLMNRREEAELFVQEFSQREAEYFAEFAGAFIAMLKR